jgi:hypothetical protein
MSPLALDIICIVFACVTANHLGLISAVEDVIRHRLPIINCPKCLTFWCTLIYGIVCCDSVAIPILLALSLLASYAAVWLELIECLIDNLYLYIYDKQIKQSAADTPAADSLHDASAGSMPDLQ